MTTQTTPGSAGKILLVDDDRPLLNLLSKMLERGGYVPLAADNAKDALELYDANKGDVRLVITDLVMSGEDGAEFVDDLRKVDPGARILVSTGYYNESDLAAIEAKGIEGIILKPYQSAELLRRVSEVLAS
jgi:CheY-like chemotaxis protein